MYSVELRKQTQQEREQIREAIQNQKRQEFNEIKKLKEMNVQKRLEILKKHQDEKFRKHDIIKLQEELGSVKKKEYLETKKHHIKSVTELKKKEEAALKNQRELEVLNMEKLEFELIKKLQQTQALQKAAFEELEVALAEKPDDYERKFLPKKSGKRKVMSREISGQLTPLSVKNSDLHHLRSSEQNALSSGKGYYHRDGFKGQPDSKVEEIESSTSQQKILMMPEIENVKNKSDVEPDNSKIDSSKPNELESPKKEVVQPEDQNQKSGDANPLSEPPKEEKQETAVNQQEEKPEINQESENVKE